ncbi:MAG: glycosyltransferase family 4 protein [Thermoplasmata archaeon]|nr:glycosyltransferase family 4 protein [Thermoplasmata archaeon]
MRVLAVGNRFFAEAHAGDKTFWLDLARRLASQGEAVHVVSVSRTAAPTTRLGEGLTMETLAAVPIYTRGGAHRDRYNPESADIRAVTNYASRSLTLPRLFRRLRQLAREWRPDVVHFMDNMGPVTGAFLRSLPVPAFVSAITYDPRSISYDLLLRQSFAGFEGVAVSSTSFRNRLGSLGVPRDRLATVPWGVDPVLPLTPQERSERRDRLGVGADDRLIFWAGFLQQTTQEDLFQALEVARQARGASPRLQFVFCLKPQHFRPSYSALESPGVRVSGDPQTFFLAREGADVFLNPVGRSRSIVAPPLTWVECMMRGIPVLTTPCGGADEVLGDGQAGEAVPPVRLPTRLRELVEDPTALDTLQRGARAWATRHYSLDGSAEAYRRLWADGIRRRAAATAAATRHPPEARA